jgi:hypothetical protein
LITTTTPSLNSIPCNFHETVTLNFFGPNFSLES